MRNEVMITLFDHSTYSNSLSSKKVVSLIVVPVVVSISSIIEHVLVQLCPLYLLFIHFGSIFILSRSLLHHKGMSRMRLKYSVAVVTERNSGNKIDTRCDNVDRLPDVFRIKQSMILDAELIYSYNPTRPIID